MTNRSDDQVVAVKIPLRVWGRLATAAENRGVTVADVLVAAAERVIGDLPERPNTAVQKRAVRGRRSTPEQVEQAKQMLQSGVLSHAEVAAAVGCHVNTVHKWARRLRESREAA